VTSGWDCFFQQQRLDTVAGQLPESVWS